MEVGGGFGPIDLLAIQAPTFSLYGDGTVIYRSPQAPEPSPLPSPFAEVIRYSPFAEGRLSEAEVQDLLQFALDTGGLRTAAETYDPGNVADAPTTIFTIAAGGVDKRVAIVALGMGPWPSDDPAMSGFTRLADRLDALDVWGRLPETFQPDGYRTALTELQLEQPPAVHPWPWPDRSPGDWTLPVDPDRPQLPTLVMTPAEISAIGIPEASGGLLNILLQGPDGKVYTLAVRPLLPDEAD
jgi:hypothetical protein